MQDEQKAWADEKDQAEARKQQRLRAEEVAHELAEKQRQMHSVQRINRFPAANPQLLPAQNIFGPGTPQQNNPSLFSPGAPQHNNLSSFGNFQNSQYNAASPYGVQQPFQPAPQPQQHYQHQGQPANFQQFPQPNLASNPQPFGSNQGNFGSNQNSFGGGSSYGGYSGP